MLEVAYNRADEPLWKRVPKFSKIFSEILYYAHEHFEQQNGILESFIIIIIVLYVVIIIITVVAGVVQNSV
jgi:hypothetical protein